MRALEVAGDYTARLATLEALKALPLGAVWDQFCLQQGVPVGLELIERVREYEARVLAQRG